MMGPITFDGVVERLVEAWGFMRRLPDPEARWLKEPQASSIYARGRLTEADIWTRFGWQAGVFDEDARPRLPGLRAGEVDRMEEAFGWVEWVEPRDRKLVGLVLQIMDRGDEAQVPWRRIAGRLGWGGHPDTLAKRWSRAVTRIAARLTREGRDVEMAERFASAASTPPRAEV
ncbi:MAG: DUF6362 family protein [Sphingomonas bacterium]|nr:DUF6362 family protein [Sphingomonas bacterium]